MQNILMDLFSASVQLAHSTIIESAPRHIPHANQYSVTFHEGVPDAHGGMHALKDTVQPEILILLKIVPMCLILALSPGYVRLTTVFCCSTSLSVQFGVNDDPCT